MPTDKPRFTITMDDDLLQRIDEFKFSNRYKNQTQAVIALIEKGIDTLALQDEEISSAIKNASETESSISKANDKSNIQKFADVLSRTGLINKSNDLSDDDLEFLKAILLALKAHFNNRKKRSN
nr:MAG TPA: nickel responsive regulator [Herelleviridae sp.]